MMLLNILSHVIRHDKPGREVQISAEISSLGLVVIIKDTGYGILVDALALQLAKAGIEYQGGKFDIDSRLDGTVVRLSFSTERLSDPDVVSASG